MLYSYVSERASEHAVLGVVVVVLYVPWNLCIYLAHGKPANMERRARSVKVVAFLGRFCSRADASWWGVMWCRYFQRRRNEWNNRRGEGRFLAEQKAPKPRQGLVIVLDRSFVSLTRIYHSSGDARHTHLGVFSFPKKRRRKALIALEEFVERIFLVFKCMKRKPIPAVNII